MDGRSPGILCRMGRSELLAGLTRGVVLSISIFGPLVGAVIAWGVDDLRTKLDRIEDRIAKVSDAMSAVQQSAAGSAATAQYQGARVDRLEQESQDHDRRITRLEATGTPR